MSKKSDKQSISKNNDKRLYETDAAALLSLRLIAAPDPKDDLSDDELAALCNDPKLSPELIKHLIEFIKSI
jgi:hypothetical protein